jgi:N-acetylgalactosamine kinase
MSDDAPLISIVLAAGKGRRMRNRYMHKVCFDIAGVPTIVRTLDTFNRQGVAQNVVVVGEMAGQVVETVGDRFSNVVFAYQPEARGTGDATRCGLQAIATVRDDARLLVVAGDKIIQSPVLAKLVSDAEESDADLQVLVSPAAYGGSSAGRVVCAPDGQLLAIIERGDAELCACRSELYDFLSGLSCDSISREEVERIVHGVMGRQVPWEIIFGADPHDNGPDDQGFHDGPWDRERLRACLEQLPRCFELGDADGSVSARDVVNSPFRNESVYLVRKSALAYGLRHMPTDNVQGEQYLTDAISAILQARTDSGRRYRAAFSETSSHQDVMSYNNPEELLRITDVFQGQRNQTLDQMCHRLGSDTVHRVDEWLEIFPVDQASVPQTLKALEENYGSDDELIRDRYLAYRRALLRFRDKFGGDRHTIIVRSPGRVNVMGRHVDWQGGCCNLMAVNQEVIMVVSPRTDDQIEVHNVQSALFPDASISLGRLVSELNWDDWLSCINCDQLERHLRQAAGKWSIYIEAAMLRVQMAYRDRVLGGMDIVVDGNIPVAAGMSSSSALVVSTAEAATAIHGLEVTPRQFVNFCGEGEWFVGTRGGSADHAAMKYGAKGTINHVKFHDFELLEQIQFPDSHRIVVCNSFMQAKKAAGAKQAFNSRVASYLLGVALVRQMFPHYAPLVEYVRDINSATLGVPTYKIYEVLLQLPETMTAEQVRRRFNGDDANWSVLAPYFRDVPGSQVYPVRGVMWFGIAECARAREAAECLKRTDMAKLGELMKVSHDGERCFRVDDDLHAEPYTADISDERLTSLIDDLTSGDPLRMEAAQLCWQPGAYRCSIREIDAIVDIACRMPGVLGAQIAGAGLGGCAMALVEAESVGALNEQLCDRFYEKRGLPSGVTVCVPSAGSSLVRVESIADDLTNSSHGHSHAGFRQPVEPK